MHKRVGIIAFVCAIAGIGVLLVLIGGRRSYWTQASPAELLSLDGFSWRTMETEHYWVHYEANSYAEKELGPLITFQESVMPRIFELLGEETYPEKVHIFLVESKARMKTLIGQETNGHAFPERNMMCSLYTPTVQAIGAHELMHVIHWNCWGSVKPGRDWLTEGLAVYADLNQRYEPHALSKHLRDSNRLPPLEKLLGSFRSYPEMVGYPASGSFVKFLYERYGREKLKELWQAPRADFRQVYGKSIPDLEAEWHEIIEGADASNIEYRVE